MGDDVLKMQAESDPAKDTYHEHAEDSELKNTGSDDKTKLSALPHELSDKYQLVREIGHGTQGKIFLARDLKHDGRLVAIKRLLIGSVQNWKEYELFQREANVLSSLDMPGVVKFHEALEFLDIDHPAAFIVQEYVEGHSLAELIAAGRRFPVNRIYDLIIQCLRILENLHHHEPPVIHRDIKPSNIMLRSENNDDFDVCLIDFGAVANPQVQGGGSTVAGTYGYMPPEQLMGNPCPQSDIYSLAVTAIHLFTNISPAEMETRDFHLIFEPYMQSMPTALIYTLRAMLDPDIHKRFSDYQKLISDFESFKNGVYDIPDEIMNYAGNELDKINNSDFEKKLRLVSSLNAPGNIELWQMLPNKTPRRVPGCYKYIRFSDYLSSLSVRSLTRARNLNGENFWDVFLKKWLLCLFFIIPLSTLLYDRHVKSDKSNSGNMNVASIGGLFFMAYIWLGYVCGLMAFTFFFPYITAGLAVLLAVISAFLSVRGTSKSFVLYYGEQATSKKRLRDRNEIPYEDQLLNNIIENGTKTVAVITDIQFVRQRDSIYKNVVNEELVCTNRPLFAIRYRFNPSDDHDPNDLFHVVHTHVAPEGNYKVGDSLPILYYIKYYIKEDLSRKSEFVYSVPFPLVMSDNLPLEKRIGASVYTLPDSLHSGEA